MGLTEVKRALNVLDKESLIKLIAELYKKDKSAKEFLDFYVTPNEQELYLKCKKKIVEAFFPKRGYKLRLSDGKKAIADFKKLGGSNQFLADLMFCYVESGVMYTNEYGDIDMPFYDSVIRVYSNALLLVSKEHILDKFAERAKAVVGDTQGIGWGFHSELSDIYSLTYDNY